MNRLLCELQRLYFPAPLYGWVGEARAPLRELTSAELAQGLAGESPVQLSLLSGETVRGMVLHFARRGDWPRVAALYQSLQEELELPAPAIAACADNGYQLWLSLAEATPVPVARTFLSALCARYLADLPPAAIATSPGSTADAALLPLVPALHAGSGRWSAFIDPGMGSMFIDESGLDMAPNLDRQADMLAGLRSISAAALQKAQQLLCPAADLATASPAAPAQSVAGLQAGRFDDPQSFLLAVMNDATVSLNLRIKAAAALLPYSEKGAK